VGLVPTAAARGRPDLAAAHGIAAFGRAARAAGTDAVATAINVVDASSAADPHHVAALAAADVIHLPGGDPDLVPAVMRGSPAWGAIEEALAAGAVLAGASAGAMALATWTWTAQGGVAGLGIVPGLAVVPHADRDQWASALERFGRWAPAGLGLVGLAERTGAIAEDVGADPIRWRVVGPGEVRWQAVRAGPTTVVRSGESFETPGGRS
jgi:cyanophycinase-like exopeptidase